MRFDGKTPSLFPTVVRTNRKKRSAVGRRCRPAHTPHMDRIARSGCVGRSNNVPKPLTPASDVATLSLFGYDPLTVYTGRAPLEAAAPGIALGPDDWAIR